MVKEYYTVTFKWYETDTWCSNICLAYSCIEVRQYYESKYGEGNVIVTCASDSVVESARRRGMPFIEL